MATSVAWVAGTALASPSPSERAPAVAAAQPSDRAAGDSGTVLIESGWSSYFDTATSAQSPGFTVTPRGHVHSLVTVEQGVDHLGAPRQSDGGLLSAVAVPGERWGIAGPERPARDRVADHAAVWKTPAFWEELVCPG